MSIFSKEKTDDQELSSLLSPLNSKNDLGDDLHVPNQAGQFLGIEPVKEKKSFKGGLTKIVGKVFPGSEEYIGKDDNAIQENLVKETEKIKRKAPPMPPVITDPSANSELEAMLKPLIQQEVDSILSTEYSQEVMFVKYEKEKDRKNTINLFIAGMASILFLLMTIKYAAGFINPLIAENAAVPNFLFKAVGQTTAQGIIFVTAMASVLIAFITGTIMTMEIVNNFLYGRAKSLIMAAVGGAGLLFWLGLLASHNYLYSLLVIVVTFLVVRRLEE